MFDSLIYIDPGSGSLLFQAILSGLLTILVFFKQIVAYLRLRIFGKTKKEVDLDNLD